MNSNLTFKYGANDIAAQLRRDINSGILQRFERLPPERSLSLKFNVSRGTIRAAINKLETEGLVTTKAGSGTYISKKIAGKNSSVIQNARPLELVDARFALEPHICRLAVVHGRKKDFEKLNNLLEEMEKNSYKLGNRDATEKVRLLCMELLEETYRKSGRKKVQGNYVLSCF